MRLAREPESWSQADSLHTASAAPGSDGLRRDGAERSAARLHLPRPALRHVSSLLPELLQALRSEHHGSQAVRLQLSALPVPAHPTGAWSFAGGKTIRAVQTAGILSDLRTPGQHEIVTNPAAVDLLVQLAYVAAKDGGLKGDLIPVGLGLEASRGGGTTTEERLELDTLGNESYQREVIVALINELPPISEMRAWLLGEDMTLQDRLMHRTRKLSEMRNRSVSVSAWRLLRFIVASNTSYLKHIEDQDELVQGIPPEYRQFRFVVGDPAKEHRLAESIKKAQKDDPNAVKYPTLLAWHGSSVRNWHSILRQGLHFRDVINGRAYGHGSARDAIP